MYDGQMDGWFTDRKMNGGDGWMERRMVDGWME